MSKKAFSIAILLGLTLTLLVSCDKDFNELGSNIIGDNSSVIETYTDATVKSYNQKTGPIASNNLPVNPLGIYNNPAFGTTTANFVTQLELATTAPVFNNTDPSLYVELPEIETVVLDVPFFSKLKKDDLTKYQLDSIYPKSNKTKFKLSVYPSNYYLRDVDLSQNLSTQQLFYTNQNDMIESNKINVVLNDSTDAKENSEFYFNDETTKDAKENLVAPSFKLHLNKAYFNDKILKAPKDKLANNANFKNYFRGLYFKVEDVGNGGEMAMLDFKKGKITIYYKEDKITPDNVATTSVNEYKKERVRKTFVLNLAGNTISLLNNSNENSNYLAAINNPTQEAETLYLKGGEGSVAIIDLFGTADLDNNGVLDEIDAIKANKWMINEANLTFTIDKSKMAVDGIDPFRVFLYDLTNKKVVIDYVLDGTKFIGHTKFDKYVHGGILLDDQFKIANKKKDAPDVGTKYKIRITEHIKGLLKEGGKNVRLGLVVTEDISNVGMSKLKLPNSDFDSAPSMSVANPLGTILHGSASTDTAKKLKLEIYYTKPN